MSNSGTNVHLKTMPVEPWLEAFIESLDPPNPLTYDYVTKVGRDALTAKMMDIEMFNMDRAPNLRKRMVDRLELEDIAAIMLKVFTIRNIQLSKQVNEGMLGVYVESTDDQIWQDASALTDPIGTYTTKITYIYYLATLVSLKVRDRDMNNLNSMLSAYAQTVTPTTDKHLFPVNNGIYNQKTKTLLDFSPKFVYLTKIRSNYNEQAKNVIIDNPDGTTWDVESWIDDLSVEPDVATLLWQVIAASIQPNRGMNKSIWFYSETGNNGKGTLGQLIKNLLSEGNYSSLSVADFKHEFLKQDLIGVAANISDENDVDGFIDSVKDYKASVTGDDVIVNRKHKDPIKLQFRGLNIQMMNGLPKTKDKSGSFYRRLILVPFIKSFTNNGEKGYIKTDYINRQEVLEYVLLKALQLEFDEFIVPQASSQLMGEYMSTNNPVLDFWEEMSEQFVWDLVPTTFLYDLYQKWFELNSPSGKPIGSRSFNALMSTVVDADPAWENHISRNATPVRAAGRMDDDEPLISEYGLDSNLRNGAPSPWIDQSYAGKNAEKKRHFPRREKYRGVKRV